MFNKRNAKTVVAVIAMVVLASGGGVAYVFRYAFAWDHDLMSEYPDAPFEKFPADFPRVINVREAPDPKDQEAFERFKAERMRAAQYLREDGAICRTSAEERQALQTVMQEKYVRGRKLLDDVLSTNPESIPAMYGRAIVLYEAEASLPRALFQVRKARRLLEARGQANPADADAREWYFCALNLEYSLLSTLDRNIEALRVAELMERIYQPMPWLKIWILLKLNRLDEAEAAIAACEKDGGHPTRVANSRGALATRRRQREVRFETVEETQSMVILKNAGSAAMGEFRFDDAEKLFLKATAVKVTDYDGTPWLDLTMLYLQQARLADAVAAYKKAQSHRAQRDLSTLQVDAGRCDMGLARLLLVANRPAAAERLARRACDQPDRIGNSLEGQASHSLGRILMLWTILEARLEELREQAVVAPWQEGLMSDVTRQQLSYEAWTLKRRLRTLLSGELVADALRPNLVGPEENWILAGLMTALPPGQAAEALRAVQATDNHPLAAGYFAVFAAEAALSGGRAEEAGQFAAEAVAKLPEAEKLLCARARAVAAEAALRRGDTAAALEHLDQVLVLFPAVLRLLKTSVPVHVTHDGSPLAERAAAQLLRSPRLRSEDAGFPITIKCQDGSLRIEMSRMNQAPHIQESISVDTDPEQTVAAVYKRFHDRLMSPAVELSQVEINALDDSPTAMQARSGIEQIMSELRPKK